jgi:hypothetical protein
MAYTAPNEEIPLGVVSFVVVTPVASEMDSFRGCLLLKNDIKTVYI